MALLILRTINPLKARSFNLLSRTSYQASNSADSILFYRIFWHANSDLTHIPKRQTVISKILPVYSQTYTIPKFFFSREPASKMILERRWIWLEKRYSLAVVLHCGNEGEHKALPQKRICVLSAICWVRKSET